MSISILSNPASIAAENQLNITNNNLQKTLVELSSGSRINTGADDAAGLAVANGLMANITALTQSAQNASDGVGKLQVADGALAQVTTLLNRAVTLATESANGTLSDAERAPLQAEFASIQAEINRIGATTNFNGQQVFQSVNANTVVGNTAVTADTSLGGTPLTQVSGSATTSGAAILSAGTSGSTWASNIGGLVGTTDLTNGGANNGDVITLNLTNPGTGAQSSYSFTIGQSYGGVALTSLTNFDTILANTGEFTTNIAGGVLTITANAATVSLTDASGTLEGAGHTGVSSAATTPSTFTIGTTNPFTYTTYGVGSSATVGNMIDAINADGRYTASLNGNGNVVIGYGTVAEPSGMGTNPALATSGGGTWAFGAANAFVATGATKTFTVQPYKASQATTFYDQGSLTVGALMTDLQSMGLSATLNGNGDLVIADPNNPNNAPTIGGTTTALGTFAAGGQASVAGATDIYLTDDSANAANTIAVDIGALSASNMNGADISSDNLSTQSSAQSALTDISNAINDVAALRGDLGASVNRLQSASNVINNDIQNLTSAQDQIMAADIPTTVANMSQYSIMEQTGVAALAQANQMQQLVLKLLQ